ncbi:MAG: hypothetical protein ACRDHE_05645 [Ktedonobacterales bacterium]
MRRRARPLVSQWALSSALTRLSRREPGNDRRDLLTLVGPLLAPNHGVVLKSVMRADIPDWQAREKHLRFRT